MLSARSLRHTIAIMFGLLATQAAANTTKPPLTGLISMGRITFVHHQGTEPDNSLDAIAALPGAFSGVSINIAWRQLQPTADRFYTSALDRALAGVQAYNRLHPASPLGVRLRIYGSAVSPDWAKHLGGDPVHVIDRQDQPITIPRFWSPPFIQAWSALQQRLAARYDDNPLIREVSITACTSRADEPFILPLDDVSRRALHEAGFSDAAYRACLLSAPGIYAGAWKQTRVDYTINPFQCTDAEPHLDIAFSEKIMAEFRNRFGGSGTLMNHGLIYPVRPRLQPLYQEMQRLGPEIEFQMFSPNTEDWDAAIDYAARTLHANAIELWPPFGPFHGFAAFSPATLQKWSSELKANPVAR